MPTNLEIEKEILSSLRKEKRHTEQNEECCSRDLAADLQIIRGIANGRGLQLDEQLVLEILRNSLKDTPPKIARFVAQLLVPPREGSNSCEFSPCRQFRYQLTHEWDELFDRKEIAFIGLNPSTADESKLDPTLTRLRGFCTSWGYNTFHMLNLFGYRSTVPPALKEVADAVGPDNDRTLRKFAESDIPVVFCWGSFGTWFKRAEKVIEIFKGRPMYCISTTQQNHPSHPLYLSANLKMVAFDPNNIGEPS